MKNVEFWWHLLWIWTLRFTVFTLRQVILLNWDIKKKLQIATYTLHCLKAFSSPGCFSLVQPKSKKINLGWHCARSMCIDRFSKVLLRKRRSSKQAREYPFVLLFGGPMEKATHILLRNCKMSSHVWVYWVQEYFLDFVKIQSN